MDGQTAELRKNAGKKADFLLLFSIHMVMILNYKLMTSLIVNL